MMYVDTGLLSPCRQRGMTLIEIMIAMLIGVFLLGGLIQIFTNSRHAYGLQQAVGQLQESGRFTLDFMADDLRMADFWMCRPLYPKTIMSYTVQGGAVSTGISGTNDVGINNSDSIMVAWQTGAWVGGNICTPTGPGLAPNNWVNYTVALGSSGNDTSLYRQTNADPQPVELIEGVENMQILYGEDTDGDYAPNYYVTADLVVNMVRVRSVRVSLLVASLANVASQPQPYLYNGITVTPTDFKIRHVFNSTITLRNRVVQ